jgi:nitrite reductase (NADH) large subunit
MALQQQPETTLRYLSLWQQPPVVVIGAGPVGQRVAAELRSGDNSTGVVMFGDEPCAPYDRVRLSSYLAGDIDDTPLIEQARDDTGLMLYLGTRIVRIDRDARVVVDDAGEACPYSQLVLATGSQPLIPPIPGVDLPDVFTFRNLFDAERLKARTLRSRHMIVIGGGLLGLETARALRRFNTRVTVVEQATRLMFHQLDDECARALQRRVADLGIEVMTGMRVIRLIGNTRIEGVQLSDDRLVECDSVVVAAGILPNIGLAQECGLHTARGVLVDDQLRTNDPRIFAVGECAEHRQTLYGLVAPGYEQASVAAHVINGDDSSYSGSIRATRLKVVGCPVMSVGEVETEWARREITRRDRKNGTLRKVFLDGDRLDAAMALGDWDEFSRIQEAVRTRRRVRPWRALRFRLTGSLWSDQGEGSVADWPASATVCNCKGIRRGQLTTAIDAGCTGLERLARQTGASTVCGSCKPLLIQLLGVIDIEPVRGARILVVSAIVAAVVALFWFLPVSIPYADSVQASPSLDMLWRNGLFKQITGFTLLGFSVSLALVSVRKRTAWMRWGDFGGWRAVHVLLGVLTATVLVAHTGFRLGDNLNFYLMIVFAGLLMAGAAAGAVMGLQHVLPLSLARRTRELSLWMHVLLIWPLPALLGFHILKTYWY